MTAMKLNTAQQQQMQAWFEHFHTNAEISWQEFKTTEKLAQILQALGISYTAFDNAPGLFAEIGTGDEVIAVRADIDALWQEVDGVMQANHSCGHDANMTMVLGALLLIKEKALNKRIRFIFQPAEETGGGALAMVERGAMQNVSHLFGVHLRPIEELPLGKVTPAIYHGAAWFLQGKITGVDAHGARPHQGQNAIDVLMAIHTLLQQLHINPSETYSAKVTKMVADGGSINIIPGIASFSIDVRAQKNAVLHDLQQKIDTGLAHIKAQYAIDLTWEWLDFTPGAEVADEAKALATHGIAMALGNENLAEAVITPGADDFHFYTVKHPEVKAAMLGIGADLQPGLHHPKMTFNKVALYDGAEALAQTLLLAAGEDTK